MTSERWILKQKTGLPGGGGGRGGAGGGGITIGQPET